jgi:dethiobiotin synthetase
MLVARGSSREESKVTKREMGGARLLVAGDKSTSGKSTCSLGLLAALLEAGIPAAEIAYIKPVTQCVSSTLTARFCQDRGITYEHIGPLVFYRGCTRKYLDAPDDSLPAVCAAAVERISAGKRVTVIDGVGYPSVGSVVGCSSAEIAISCRSPVLLVGRPGVGDAIDSFNLCATYFEAQRVPVLGAIFNKLPEKGFYSLDSCAKYHAKYFARSRPKQRVYGLLPLDERLASLGGEEACSFAFKHPETPPEAGALNDEDRAAVALLTEHFRKRVDTAALLADLERATTHPAEWARDLPQYPEPAAEEGSSSKRHRS